MEEQESTLDFVVTPGPEAKSESEAGQEEDSNLGRRVGPYRIESRLGAGGMGVVYLARRENDFEQRVALKLVRRSRGGSDEMAPPVEVLRRFFDERQILAGLDHPNIARIFDGGTTDDALPYFVMEHVEGQRIDDYCHEHGLSLVRRLGLFRQVCEAVHFAHQSLVVHRDIKPDNILVTPDGVPKLLDFGIAKILSAKPRPANESRGARPMTPGYASPEQVLGGPITTASDVYSLGILLYRLVSGHHPYPVDASEGDWIEQILESKPIPPSAVGEELPLRRFADDIDAIVHKAMAKDPRDRYPSALQLAEDLGRHLDDQPVMAYSGGWFYQLRKLVRRQRLAAAFAVFLAGFAVVVTVLWRQAVEQRQRADQARLSAEAVSSFFGDLFLSADPDTARGESLTVREVLDQGREELGDGLGEAPEIRAELLNTLGTVYHNLGLHQEAREVAEEALRSRLAADPSDRADLAGDLNNLGRLDYDLGDYAAAEVRFREAMAMWERLGDDGAKSVFTLRNLAGTLVHRGAREEALEIFRRVLAIQEELYGPDALEVALSLYGLGALHRVQGEPDEAMPLLRRALGIYGLHEEVRPSRVAQVENSLGRVMLTLDRLPEAREHLERALEIRRELLGDDHVSVANTRKNLAAVLLAEGDPAAAAQLAEEAFETLLRHRPEGDWMTADAAGQWGSCLAAMERFEEAEPKVVEGWLKLKEVRGEDHADTRSAWERVVDLYRAWEREIPPSLGG